jgi:UDP-glucose 4-epimerase
MDDVALRKALDGIDTVFHLVSTTFPGMTIESSVYDVLSNLLPTIRLLEICISNGVKKIVYASSGGTIYGEPSKTTISEDHQLLPKSAYGQSKLTIENYLRFYARTTELEVNILRISNPFGPRQNPYGIQGLIAVAMGCAYNGRTVKIFGKGETVRDYIYIDDVIDALLLAAKRPGSFITNISTGKGYSVVEIIDAIEKVTGKVIRREFVPMRKGDVTINVLENRLAYEIYGWKPKTRIEDGLSNTWEWIKKRFAMQSQG